MEYRYNNLTKTLTVEYKGVKRTLEGDRAVKMYKELSNYNTK